MVKKFSRLLVCVLYCELCVIPCAVPCLAYIVVVHPQLRALACTRDSVLLLRPQPSPSALCAAGTAVTNDWRWIEPARFVRTIRVKWNIKETVLVYIK